MPYLYELITADLRQARQHQSFELRKYQTLRKMLSDKTFTEEEKTKIITEERLRFEIRQTLEQAKPKATFSILGFLNSSLGIWLLSTVVVGLTATLYNSYQQSREHSEKLQEKITRLDIEISYRLSFVQKKLGRVYRDTDDAVNYIFSHADCLDNNLLNVFPELKDRRLEGLLYEVEQLTTDHRNARRKARVSIMNIRERLYNIKRKTINVNQSKEDRQEAFRKKLAVLRSEMRKCSIELLANYYLIEGRKL